MALLAASCANPNVYGTPRTIPSGSVSHSISAEALTVTSTYIVPEYGPPSGPSDDGSVLLPSYAVRIGLGVRTDLGVRAVNMALPGLDVKFNLFRSRWFDMAINPAMQGFLPIPDWAHLHLPLLLGFNVAESVSIVVTPGLLHTPSLYASVNLYPDRHTAPVVESKGLMTRLGLGINVRLFRGFALHPEITLLRPLESYPGLAYKDVTWFMMGLGFNFGTLPSFADVGGNESEACD